MSTVQAEQPLPRPIPNGDITHHPALDRPSKHRLLASIDAFIRDFPRPIRTFNLRRQEKPVQNLARISKADSHTQNAAIVSSQSASQGEQIPNRPAVSQQLVPVTSAPGEQESHAHSQIEGSPPGETGSPPAKHGEASNDATPLRNPLLEVIGTLAIETGIDEQTPVPSLVPAASHTQAGPSSAQKGIETFVLRKKNLYEATKLRPEKSLRDQWRKSGKPTIDKRLKNLRLGPNSLFNLRLCMMGPSADENAMKPTILIVCDIQKVKVVESDLKDFIRLSFPGLVDFKVIPGSVRLTSGALSGLPSKPGDRTNFTVFALSEGASFPFLAIVGDVKLEDINRYDQIRVYDTCTIGVREGKFVDKFVERRFDRPCGSIEFYQWSGDEDIELEDPSGDAYMTTKPAIAMDWMLLRLNSHYTAHNTFRSLDGTVQQNVSGFVATAELLDDEVWIFSTRPQIGILDSTPSTIILGQISYDVFSIALVSPLDAGDSGSWVVRDHKLCGYIFARLDGVALAYMLPIEPVFGEISRLFSKDAEVKVDVPDATTIESWLGRGQPLEITVDNVSTVETKLPNTPHGRIRSSSMSVTSSQAFDSELSTTHVDLISRPSPWKTIEPGLDAREDGPSQIREEPPVREELPIYEAFPPSRPSETSPRSQTDSPFVPRIFVNGINPFGSRRSRLRGLNTPALRNRTPPSQFIESQRPEPVLGGDLVLGIGEGRSIPLLDMSNFSQSPRPILPPSSMSDSTRHQEALPLVTGASDLDLELGQEALRPPRSQTRLKWLNKVKEQQSLRVRKTIAFLVEVLLVVVYFAIIGALTGTITIFPSLHITVVGKALGIVAMVVALIAWILLVGWFLVRKVLVRKVEAHEEAEPTSREDSRRY